ncbi:MAG TPA: DUF748 domain-containing protein, partial [Terriglobales bacterium]|nr:DUF748 domain-containing protein [Terriglobales bacterium]
GGGPSVGAIVERFSVRDVAVSLEDRTVTPARTRRLTLEADVSGVSTLAARPPGTAAVRASVDGAPIVLTATDLKLAPLALRATLTARDLDASIAALALPPASPFTPARGRVHASATLAHDAANGTVVTLEATSKDVALFRYHTAFLTAPSVRLAVDELRMRAGVLSIGRVTLDGGTITLADAQLGTARRWHIDGLALEALALSSARDAAPGTATASARMAGAQVSLWATNVRLAPVELHATTIVRNVDLAVMRAYLPPALPVQPERGVVNATVRVDHDAAHGTRLAVDAGMADLVVARPGHIASAPAMRLVAGDIAVAGGAVTIGNAALTSDRVILDERGAKRTWVVQSLALEAKNLSSRPTDVQGTATVQATVAGGSVAAWVTGARFAPLALQATASLRNLDLSVLRLYLPTESPVEFTRGAVNAALQVSHSAADGTRLTGDATLTGVDARGRWQLSTMALTAPSLRVTVADARHRGETFSVGRLEVAAAGTMTDTRGARIDVASATLATEGLAWPAAAPARVQLSARFQDRGQLDASGTARLTAPPPALAWATDLDLKVRGVDLAPLAAYVPAARGFSGRVRGTLSASVASGPGLTARVRGDVAGSRFALVEDGRTLLSLRRLNVTGLDVQWPERIAIGQLRLGQPTALIERDRQGVLPLMARFAAPASVGMSASAEPTSAPAPAPPTAIYRLGAGDILDIRLTGSMSREPTLYTVLSNGTIDYPLAG